MVVIGGRRSRPRGTVYINAGWQEEAVRLVESDSSSIVVAPTGAGKSIVAYAAASLAARTGRRTMIVEPTVGLALDMAKRVRGYADVAVYTRDYSSAWSTVSRAPAIVATPGKALAILHMITDKTILVLDEIHQMLYTPEYTTLAAYALLQGATIHGMTATIHEDTLGFIAKWLGASIVRGTQTSKPPGGVHHAMVTTMEKGVRVSGVETLHGDPMPVQLDGVTARWRTMLTATLVARILDEDPDARVMVWAPHRRTVESIAKHIARLARLPGHTANVSTGMDWLDKTLSRGVAAHHGGLPPGAAGRILDAVLSGGVRVLVSAYTLLQGVDLKMDYLVMHTAYGFDGEPLPPDQFIQLMGRVGRPGARLGHVIILEEDPGAARMVASSTPSPGRPRVSVLAFYRAAARLIRDGRRRDVYRLEELHPGGDGLAGGVIQLMKMYRFLDDRGRVTRRGVEPLNMGLTELEYEGVLEALRGDRLAAHRRFTRFLMEFKPMNISVDDRVEYLVRRYGYAAGWRGVPWSIVDMYYSLYNMALAYAIRYKPSRQDNAWQTILEYMDPGRGPVYMLFAELKPRPYAMRRLLRVVRPVCQELVGGMDTVSRMLGVGRTRLYKVLSRSCGQ